MLICIITVSSCKSDCWRRFGLFHISSLYTLEDCTLMSSEAQMIDRIFLLVSVTVRESYGQFVVSIILMRSSSWLCTSARDLLLDVSSFFSSWTSEVPYSCKAVRDIQFLGHISMYPKKEVCILSGTRL